MDSGPSASHGALNNGSVIQTGDVEFSGEGTTGSASARVYAFLSHQECLFPISNK